MVNFIIGHFGIQTGGNYSFEAFWMAMDTPNVYCESGWCFQSRIVEFAQQDEAAGMSPVEAAVRAARDRLRPILMTSFAFIFGTLPLAIASGAGANSRIAIGTAVVAAPPDPADTVRGTTMAAEWKPAPSASPRPPWRPP